MATLANADKEVQKAINKEKKLVKPILLKPQPLKRVQHRLPPRPPQPPPQLRRHHTVSAVLFWIMHLNTKVRYTFSVKSQHS